MATKTIVTCDACGDEMDPTRMIEFAAALWRDGVTVEKFDVSQFCGQQCVINAVAALLNGTL
jgi:hypothetical protein